MHAKLELADSDFSQTCFHIPYLDPSISGWIGVWALYNIFIKYLPIIFSVGFIFLNFLSKSTTIHFLTNITAFIWILNISLEYKFRISALYPTCIANIRIGDVKILGPVFGFPPIEIAQSSGLIFFFVFYLYFWKNIWWNTFIKQEANKLNDIIRNESSERSWVIVLFILLLIQNPLLLWIRSVYDLFEIAVGILIGILSAINIIMVYLYFKYMFNFNTCYKFVRDEKSIICNYPSESPICFFNLFWI